MTLNPYIEAHELRELVLKKEVRPREVAEFFLARVEKLNPRLGAFMTVTADRALADASRLEKMNASDAAMLPLFGVAIFAQGPGLDQGHSHHLRLEELRELARARRRGTRRAARQLRRNSARQNHHPRIRPASDHRGRSLSARAKSLEPRTHRRRLQRRFRLRRRLRTASRGAGQRRRWIDSHTVGMLRRGRNQTVAWANHARAAGRRRMERAFHYRPDRAHRPRRRVDARCDGGDDAGRPVRGAAAGASIRRGSFRASKKTSARIYQP